jgi:YVTN family beta-propeller protein
VRTTTAITIPVGSDPGGIAADPATHTVYVANQGSGTVTVINDATNSVTTTTSCTLAASLGGHGLPSGAVIENSSAPGYPGYLYVSSSGGPVVGYTDVNAPR